QASTQTMRHTGVTFLNWRMNVSIQSFPLSSPLVASVDCGSGRGEEPSGVKVLRLIQDRLSAAEFEKISTASQENSATTNHRLGLQKAVSFSSARTTKRFPSSRCASATQIVQPNESKTDTQLQLHPALLRLSAMISQYFMRRGFTAAFPHRVFGN